MHTLTAQFMGRPGFHRMGRHGHHRHGPHLDPRAFWHGPWRGMAYGPGGRRGRARRGDVRAAILLLLEDEPRNGYGLMEEIESRSGGAWRPSPGSVYPALAQLEDEGLVTTVEQEGKRLFTLTDEGRRFLTLSSDLWYDAAVAGGNDHAAARAAAGRTTAAYVPPQD